MAPIIFLALLLGTAVAGPPSTISPSDLRSILCRNHFLARSDRCRDLSPAQREDPSPTPIAPTPAVNLTLSVSMSVGVEIAIALGVAISFYIILIIFLKYRIGLPWSRAIALGVNAGRVTSRCFIYIYPRPETAVAETDVESGV